MPRKTYTGRRKPRLVGDGRTYGAKLQGPKPQRPEGPSKRQEAADAALASILELFESETLPARIAETLIARAEGESPAANWSLGNQILMLLGGTADARGFSQWKEVGRHVSKGAKAIYILAPLTRKRTETDKTTGEESTRVFVSGFKAIPVFRVEDTEGFSVTPVDYHPLQTPPLIEVAEALGVSVRYAPSAGRFRGYYCPGTDSIMLVTHDAVTFFHELAHAAHKRVLEARGASLKNGQDKGQEIVAETVAAVLCRLYDLDGYLAHSAEYIRSYGGDNPAKAAMRVLGDVSKVLTLILDEAGAYVAPAPAPVLAAA
jgi:hypothetical protein